MKEETLAHGVQFGVTHQEYYFFSLGCGKLTFGDARLYRTTARCTLSLLEAIVTRLYSLPDLYHTQIPKSLFPQFPGPPYMISSIIGLLTPINPPPPFLLLPFNINDEVRFFVPPFFDS